MDLFDLLILALIAVPVLFRWLEQSRRKAGVEQSPGSPPAAEDGHRRESEFERALREIGLTLQGQRPDEESAPTAAPPSHFDNDGFSREEQFEKHISPPPVDPGRDIPFQELQLARIGLSYTKKRSSFSPQARRLRSQLKSARNVRQAILLSEILQPPLALRGRHRAPR